MTDEPEEEQRFEVRPLFGGYGVWDRASHVWITFDATDQNTAALEMNDLESEHRARSKR